LIKNNVREIKIMTQFMIQWYACSTFVFIHIHYYQYYFLPPVVKIQCVKTKAKTKL